ncbi:MAG: ATP-dependent protease ATPase subunit HslU [Christensenellaceae bacterium]|jgi:ATP-dependent HslUV protease ATP-binding subunit HslU|nr:ATP-dependent protease ATPase subunit HslU [Christensenellaceae bacterium]
MEQKDSLTPKEIVEQLDRFIIGQSAAKRAVAVALRNRYRRNQLEPAIRDEITPKNIILKGPTGVGKTEIARRLARLVGAPFVKVEATKYTEVGYVGRDVESMIRDLVEVAVRMVKEKKQEEVKQKAEAMVEKKIIAAVVEAKKKKAPDVPSDLLQQQSIEEYRTGKLDKFTIEIEVADAPAPAMHMPMGAGMEIGIDIGNIFGSIMPKRARRRTLTVEQAREQLIGEESDRLVDKDAVNAEAINLAEQNGIVFIDEIDKIGSVGGGSGPEVSREGVQRDILPIVEGCTVQTKYGAIKTDYILFIAAGAFHISRIQDLIPELQGRFPIRVELNSLSKDDFYKILTVPENALTKQYTDLLRVDNVNLVFEDEALKMVADLAEQENETAENLGARRLHNIIEVLLEDVSFNATNKKPMKDVKIDQKFVKDNMANLLKKTDLRKYVL